MATITPRLLDTATLTSSLADIYVCPASTTTRIEHTVISNSSTAGTVTVAVQSNVGVTNKSLTSNVATLTTARPHSFSVGQSITVSGVDSTFNGTYTITAVGRSTVSYAKTNADISSTAATGSIAGPAVEQLNAYAITANGILELFNLILEAGDKLQASAATTTGAKISIYGTESV
jgi:hypothetical protein